MEDIESSQVEILEMKNTVSEMKKNLNGINYRLRNFRRIISDPEGMAIETTQNEIHREKRLGKKCTSLTVGQHQVF